MTDLALGRKAGFLQAGLTWTLGRGFASLPSGGHSPFPRVVWGFYLRNFFFFFSLLWEIIADSGRGDGDLEELKSVPYRPPQESCQDLARVLAAPLGQGGAVGQPGSPAGHAPLKPGCRGCLGPANHSRQQDGIFLQGKDSVSGNSEANRVKGGVILCIQEPAGKPQITDIFLSTC